MVAVQLQTVICQISKLRGLSTSCKACFDMGAYLIPYWTESWGLVQESGISFRIDFLIQWACSRRVSDTHYPDDWFGGFAR